jgi:ribose transport system substrate-binding protein
MKSKILWIMVVLVFLLMTAGYLLAGGKEEEVGVKQFNIAQFYVIVAHPYMNVAHESAREVIESAGHKLTLYDANLDAALQADQIDDAIMMGVDGLIIFPVDSKAISPSLKRAYDAGIPVLIAYAKVGKEDENYTIGYAGPDDYNAGYLSAGLMNEALNGKGKVVIIEGSVGQENVILRTKGFEEGLKDRNSKIEVVAKQPTSWDKAEASRIMEDFIVRFPDLNGVFTHDDMLGIGAALAIEEAGISKDQIVVVGYGASREGLQGLIDGQLYGTHLQSPVFTGQLEAERILEFLDAGMKVGQQLDPYFKFAAIPVITQENVEEFLPAEW